MNAPDEPLADLRHHWGSAYNIQHIGELWLAQRLDKSRATVSAKTPGGLLAKIRDDYAAQPVPARPGRGWTGDGSAARARVERPGTAP